MSEPGHAPGKHSAPPEDLGARSPVAPVFILANRSSSVALNLSLLLYPYALCARPSPSCPSRPLLLGSASIPLPRRASLTISHDLSIELHVSVAILLTRSHSPLQM